jgi:hypothetical protein
MSTSFNPLTASDHVSLTSHIKLMNILGPNLRPLYPRTSQNTSNPPSLRSSLNPNKGADPVKQQTVPLRTIYLPGVQPRSSSNHQEERMSHHKIVGYSEKRVIGSPGTPKHMQPRQIAQRKPSKSKLTYQHKKTTSSIAGGGTTFENNQQSTDQTLLLA